MELCPYIELWPVYACISQEARGAGKAPSSHAILRAQVLLLDTSKTRHDVCVCVCLCVCVCMT